MAFVSGFSGASVGAAIPSSTSSVSTPVSMSAAPSRRAFLQTGVAAAAAAALTGFGLTSRTRPVLADSDVPGVTTNDRDLNSAQLNTDLADNEVIRIEAGVPLLSGIGAAIKAGDLSQAKSLYNDQMVIGNLRKGLSKYAASFSDGSITSQGQQLLAAVGIMYDNLDSAVNSQNQREAVTKYNAAADAYMCFIRSAELTSLYDSPLKI
jgi:hypothetical protein